MLVSLTVGKVDAGVTVLLTQDKRLIEFPSILLPPNISSGSIVDITVGRNSASETKADNAFRELQENIYAAFGASEPASPVLRCRNATQTSVVLEWEPIELATSELISLSLYRNGQKAGNIPRPHNMHSTKISGLGVDTEYTFHLVLRTTSGTYTSEKVTVKTHKLTDLSGITITTGVLPASQKEALSEAVERIGAKIVDGVRIDTTHFVTTEGRGMAWEKAVENNIPVVRPEWVEACEKNGRILGVTKFYLDAPMPSPSADPNASQKELPSTPAEQSTPSQGQQTPQQQQAPPEERAAATGPAPVGDDDDDASDAAPAGYEKAQQAKGDDEEEDDSEEEDDNEAEADSKAAANGTKDEKTSTEQEDGKEEEAQESKGLPLRPAEDEESKEKQDEKKDDDNNEKNSSSRASFDNVEL